MGFDAARNEFFGDRSKAGKTAFSDKFAAQPSRAPRASTNRRLKLHLFFDMASCELFADEGKTTMTEFFFPNGGF